MRKAKRLTSPTQNLSTDLKREVFNNSIGSPYGFNFPTLTVEQEREIIAGLFEQLMIFDRVIITTSRLNFGLYFLIRQLGINTVERLIECGYIKFMIWTPVIFAGTGKRLEDGTIDNSVIYGQQPIAAGTLSDDDKDPEKNILAGLSHFRIHLDRRKIFTKKTLKNYIIPNGMEFSTGASAFIIDAYKNNNLATLGLAFDRDPDQLHVNERMILLSLGHKVLETAVLSKYGLKSFDNYEHYKICKQNLHNIGKAYNVVGNSDVLLRMEGVPNLKQLFIEDKIKFDDVFRFRHLSTAKYYRKWINEVGENCTAQEITKEYLNELKGNRKFFETTQGKFLRNLAMYSASRVLGATLAGPIGAIAEYALGALETFWLDSLLKGKNPSMFIDDIKKDLDIK